mmetsp:Transcript_55092/g.101996  ORF Transcript_55092/g.101996 Transcript_55092/m.101996 type:complete len:402 (-) Transcript_55092:198-1403(-)
MHECAEHDKGRRVSRPTTLVLLQQIVGLCGQAAEAAASEEEGARSQLDALQKQLDETREAALATSASLEEELRSLREDRVDLLHQLEKARAVEATSAAESEVLHLKARVQQLQEVTRKQRQRLNEHEARIKVYTGRMTKCHSKKRRHSDASVQIVGELQTSQALGSTVGKPLKSTSSSGSNQVKDKGLLLKLQSSSVAAPPVAKHVEVNDGDACRGGLAHEGHKSIDCQLGQDELEPMQDAPGKENASPVRQVAGARVAARPLKRTATCPEGLGIPTPSNGAKRSALAEGSNLSGSRLQRSGTVRAFGRDAAQQAMQPPAGIPCRCVVRRREDRQALHSYDCEHCRKFHAATNGLTRSFSTGADPTQQAPRSSRHKFAHAPTSTPPGFWDLSFPHDTPRLA